MTIRNPQSAIRNNEPCASRFSTTAAAEDPAAFAEDDDPSRSPVVAALRRLGHDVTPIACTLDLGCVRRSNSSDRNRTSRSIASNRSAAATRWPPPSPLLLDAMQIPYTGCSTESIVATANKISAKERLIRAGSADAGMDRRKISDCRTSGRLRDSTQSDPIRNPKFILKSVYEHASFEMDDASVVGPAAPDEIAELVRKRIDHDGQTSFSRSDSSKAASSICRCSATRPKCCRRPRSTSRRSRRTSRGSSALAQSGREASFEFQNTPRRFDFPPADAPLIRWLTDLAVECWRLFGLRGYARVDFRVDSAGQPWILEINTNPCIAPTSGFAAAVEQAGLSYDDGIQRIVEAALPGSNSIRHRRRTPGRWPTSLVRSSHLAQPAHVRLGFLA